MNLFLRVKGKREWKAAKNRLIRTGGLLLLASILLLTAACSGGNKASNDDPDKLNIVTSFYPLYFLASEIGGDRVDVMNLIPAGIEPHDWTPKSQDLTKASNAALFIYNGAGLEGWVDDFLQGLGNNHKVATLEASKGIALIGGNPEEGHDHEEEHAQEAESEAEHGHEEEHAHETGSEAEHGHEEEHEAEGEAEQGHEEEHAAEAEAGHNHSLDKDPHTWVSPKSAVKMAENIKDSLVKIDSANASEYEANFEDLIGRLKELDQKFTEELSGLPKKDIVVSHQAFGYLCRDYGLNQIAIMGLSPDAEPKAQDIIRIANYVKENDIQYIFFEEMVSSTLADTLANEAKVDTLVLNPIEGLTPEQEAKGDNYFTLMETNLQNLKKALQ
ncbi:metal ABC transporter solute-binding protein, Zn/Mn family [Paenibacillus tarimensis]|uniref:metal ABC transporter solute-binding protein, Zn/Mn family n=1 Tax=Paenibacillus tarimensis TaxID=416012 RepID=UPI001F1C9F2F|nr:zinc ABC transporter substrate-binding protein [Paenibacillus tarimensis]MCF2942409.1 zinc ABC transporter substrate-binding protein [Paenibacillus tarimensis]